MFTPRADRRWAGAAETPATGGFGATGGAPPSTGRSLHGRRARPPLTSSLPGPSAASAASTPGRRAVAATAPLGTQRKPDGGAAPSAADAAVVAANQRLGAPVPHGSRMLLQSRTHQAVAVGSLPPTVAGYLAAAGIDETESVTAVVDVASGHIAVATPNQCFVWSTRRAGAQCVQLTLSDSKTHDDGKDDDGDVQDVDGRSESAALVSFVSHAHGDTRAPGLVSCTADGVVRYWESVASASVGFRETVVPGFGGRRRGRSHNHAPSMLIACEPVGLVLGTSDNVVFRISLVDASGVVCLTCMPLMRDGGVGYSPMGPRNGNGVLRRMSSFLGYTAAEEDDDQANLTPTVSGSLVCLAPGASLGGGSTGRDLIVLSDRMIQKWALSRTQGDRLVFETDVRRAVTACLANSMGDDDDDNGDGDDKNTRFGCNDVRVEDADVTSDGEIVLLVSTLVGSDIVDAYRSCAVVMSRSHGGALQLDPSRTRPINFVFRNDSKPHFLTLLLAQGGPVFFISDETQIIVSTLEPGVLFEETLRFTEMQGRILGIGAGRGMTSTAAASALAVFHGSGHGLVRVDVFSDAIRAIADEEAAAVAASISATAMGSTAPDVARERATQIFRSRLEQAVFFGGDPSAGTGAIAFDLASASGFSSGGNHPNNHRNPHHDQVDIDAAAIAVSTSILKSECAYIPNMMDIGAHLSERMRRADRVMATLSMHGLRNAASTDTRTRLLHNVEKLAAAHVLWRYMDTVRGLPQSARDHRPSLMIVEDSLQRFMTGRLTQVDPVRDFFERQVDVVDVFLSDVVASRARVSMDGGTGRTNSHGGVGENRDAMQLALELYEINKVVVMTLHAVVQCRCDHAKRYGFAVDTLTIPNILKGVYADKYPMAMMMPPLSPMIEPWVATDRMRGGLGGMFEATHRLLQESPGQVKLYPIVNDMANSVFSSTRGHETGSYQYDVNDDEADGVIDSFDFEMPSIGVLRQRMSLQLCFVADLVLGAMHERRVYLKAVIDVGDGGGEMHHAGVMVSATAVQALQSLDEQHRETVPLIIRALLTCGRSNQAFYLAVKHREYAALVDLCLSDNSSSLSSGRRGNIHDLMSEFGAPFADVLFDAYLKRGMYRDLVTVSPQHHAYLVSFLSRADVPEIAWVFDMMTERFGDAVCALRCVAKRSGRRDRHMLAQSLAALAALEEHERRRDDHDVFVDYDADVMNAYQRSIAAADLQTGLVDELCTGIDLSGDGICGNATTKTMRAGDAEHVADQIMMSRYVQANRSCPVMTVLIRRAIAALLRGAVVSVGDMVEVVVMMDPLFEHRSPVQQMQQMQMQQVEQPLQPVSRQPMLVYLIDVLFEGVKRIGSSDGSNNNKGQNGADKKVGINDDGFDTTMSEECWQFLVRFMCRRAWQYDDWASITASLRLMSMHQARQLLMQTMAYMVVCRMFVYCCDDVGALNGDGDDVDMTGFGGDNGSDRSMRVVDACVDRLGVMQPPKPDDDARRDVSDDMMVTSQSIGSIQAATIRSLHKGISETQVQQLCDEHARDQSRLVDLSRSVDLESIFREIVRLVAIQRSNVDA